MSGVTVQRGTLTMRRLTGMGGVGVAGSICGTDLPATYNAIAATLANRGTTFPLSVPASSEGISVFVNNQLVPVSPDNYIYNSATNAIVFTGDIPSQGSTIEVVYNQSTN